MDNKKDKQNLLLEAANFRMNELIERKKREELAKKIFAENFFSKIRFIPKEEVEANRSSAYKYVI